LLYQSAALPDTARRRGGVLAQRDLHTVGDKWDDRARFRFRKFQAETTVEDQADSPPIGGIRLQPGHPPARAHQIRNVRRDSGAADGLLASRRLVSLAAPQPGQKPMDHQT
jgi:hypothetical protein